MKTKNKLLTLLIISTGAVAVTSIINKCIKLSAVSKKLLTDFQPGCFKWKFGNIHYTKCGSGKPLLLIHDLNTSSSGYEWNEMVNLLKEDYTVYTIDLLGCGRSEKPDLTYTNFLFVQLISDFIKSEIGHRTSVIASKASSSLAIMACNYNPELFDRIMLLNPESLLTCSQIPGNHAKAYKFLLNIPVLGTLLYHIASSKKMILEDFFTNNFYNPYSVQDNLVDIYYESSHLGESPKALYSSIKCNYTKCNIVNPLKKIDHSIFIVGGSEINLINEIIEEYKLYNPSIESSIIKNTKSLPQLEQPKELTKIIKTFI